MGRWEEGRWEVDETDSIAMKSDNREPKVLDSPVEIST